MSVTTARRSLAAWLILVSALDAWTTYVALRTHTAQEMNPVARAVMAHFGLWSFSLVRALIGVLVAAVLCRFTVLADGRAQQLVIWSFALAGAAWWTLIVVSNLRLV